MSATFPERDLQQKDLLLDFDYGGEKNMQVELVSTSYIKGESVKKFKIKEFLILDEPIEVETEYGPKLKCKVEYQDKGKEDPDIWQLNNTCRNALIKKYGKETKDWIGKKIPIETSLGSNNKYAIMVDPSILGTVD